MPGAGYIHGVASYAIERRRSDFMPLLVPHGIVFSSLALGHLYKSKFRRNTALFTKNYFLHIMYMPRRNFLLAPCLA